jgi:hypothetical protein
MLPFCCHKGLSNGEKPYFTGFFTGAKLLPLYGFRRQINKRNRPRDPKRTAGAVFVLRIFISS